MLNPWADLPDRAPFVATADAPYIRRNPPAAQGLQLDLLPSPYVGKPDARVYLLLLNPGGRHDDFKYGSAFVEERKRALRFDSTNCCWPLSPAMVGSDALRYVEPRLRVVIDAVGQERVVHRTMWLQYFGNQSPEWRPFPVILPSQQFAVRPLREAMSAHKVVVIGRSRKLWIAAVPELAHYNYIELRSPRSPYLTPGNMRLPSSLESSKRYEADAIQTEHTDTEPCRRRTIALSRCRRSLSDCSGDAWIAPVVDAGPAVPPRTSGRRFPRRARNSCAEKR